MVVGFVNDKDVNKILALLPKEASYYFCQASIPRALPVEDLIKLAEDFRLKGKAYPTVADAVESAHSLASKQDLIFVGGSTFVVADLLGSDQF
jgi:dihydrofolate synthase/folylpolyglutamate synthase